MLTRDLFANLSQMWLNGPSEMIEPWNAQASGRAYTGRNHFMGNNIKLLRGDISMLQFQGSPGSLSGAPLLEISGVDTAPADAIVCTLSLPALPTGWSITKAIVVAVHNVTDTGDPVGTIYVGTGAAPFTAVTINGPDHTLDYVISGWLQYLRPDGKTAYGPSLTVLASHA